MKHSRRTGRVGARVYYRDKTLGEIRTLAKGSSFNTTVRDHARDVFANLKRPPGCAVCGYSKHVEVCHIRAVCDFPASALLLEVNAPSNLIGLCPNCHWEFDNGLLQLPVAA